MTLALQQPFVMMSKYSMFGVDTINTFLSNGHNMNTDNLVITIAWLFLWNRQANKDNKIKNYRISLENESIELHRYP